MKCMNGQIHDMCYGVPCQMSREAFSTVQRSAVQCNTVQSS